MELNGLLGSHIEAGVAHNRLIRFDVKVKGLRIRLLNGNGPLLDRVVSRQGKSDPMGEGKGHSQEVRSHRRAKFMTAPRVESPPAHAQVHFFGDDRG